MTFGDKYIRRLARGLREYVDQELLRTPLSPLLCSGQQLDRVLHITASCLDILSSLNDKDILIWDAGKGSRMSSLLRGGKSKGDADVCGSHKLYHFPAGAAKWLVDTLRTMGKEYCAFVASDQIVCLSHQVKNELKSLLEVAASQNTDLIFFEGPPELSVMRLGIFVGPKRRPQKDSFLALARDRTLLKYFGGAHIFQCILLKKSLLEPLATTLHAIIQACSNGYELDHGIYDVSVVPRFVQPEWLKQEANLAAHKIYSRLCDLTAKVESVFPISVPIQVFNVNTPLVLKRLRKRILRGLQGKES
jgi:hypothetical protein